MNLTIQDLIKILPFDSVFKKELQASYDTLTQEKKFDIERVLWDTYDYFYKMKLQQNIEIAIEEAEKNQEKLDKDFYKRVRELTQNEMTYSSEEDLKTTELSQAREELSQILSGKS